MLIRAYRISRHRCHRIRATQGVMFYTAFDSMYTPASLSKPPKSGFLIGIATQTGAADSFIAVLHVHRVNLVVKPLLHGPRL
ncbi:unnamed protein product [Protopolystoma xenopodis]|uniref:Uncharacterized protein n=1 Tax=Protopolystoma xenopodis TaxID=117903 RepID=A0A3S5BVK7_9PLAT|nr:unnamed protein product [Protopolystoma xenopodis]